MNLRSLAGEQRLPTFSIYADESKPEPTCKWLIMGALFVPDDRIDEALGALGAAKARHNYHREVHFNKIRNRSGRLYGEKSAIASDWIRMVVHDHADLWNIHVRAIRPEKLDHGRFGTEAEDNIYARFFRSLLSYGIKSSIGEGAAISRVFHDDTHLENHKYFPRSSISRLRSENGVAFSRPEIEFISSNHEKPGHPAPWAAHFIQLVDVWMGAFRQVLSMCSGHAGKIEAASVAADFVKCLNDRDHKCYYRGENICAYRHRGRCSLSFFPRVRLNEAAIGSGDDMLYYYLGERLEYFSPPEQTALF